MNRLPEKDVILFDGAMGTYIAQKYHTNIKQCEFENIANPGHVLTVHREYIEAGADAIKTNTFSANTAAFSRSDTVEKIILSGCEIAEKAVKGSNTSVFASIGPIAGENMDEVSAEYRKIIDLFLYRGVRNFLFETFSEYSILTELAKYVKENEKDSFVIAECAVAPDKYTQSGLSAQSILDGMGGVPEIDAYGFNCACGPMHMLNLVREVNFRQKPASVMPNAGYPTVISGRTVFESTPDYFAQQLIAIRDCGVKFLGGCCGTTPLHIKKASDLLRCAGAAVPAREKEKSETIPAAPGRPHAKLLSEKVVAVELDSPLDADTGFFLSSAIKLSRAGADLITIADCPIGRARADSSMLAAKLRREYDIEAMPHLTCRDRNLNATKALLLGLNAENVSNVLCVTGDPIPSSDRNEIKSVFNFNSVRLASFIRDLNKTVFTNRPFTVAAALNVNAVTFDAELEKAKRKQDAGVAVFLTQPIYTGAAIENLQKAKRSLNANILGGIMPIVSYKNACFINNEVAGITIPESLIKKYEGADAEQASAIAVETSLATAREISGIADGFYMITPLKKVEIICEIVTQIKGTGKTSG
ncbi:MAG TPA: bifunctional homocysteine S-methyltransferase/methylenetetrahydrofolate reductase [Clostridia bacterium]|nr:bifunctional homocysteine S-methyltransferase/methylenetetrahydrofolate reductase [Clostridia bacterium]